MLGLNRLCLPACQISPFLIRLPGGGHLPRGRQGAAAGLEKRGMLLPWGRGKTSVISFLGVL